MCQWVQMPSGMGNLQRVIYSLSSYSNNLFAGTQYNGVYRSNDNGNVWAQTALNNLL